MADRAVVATKLEQIEQYHGELRSKQSLPKDRFLESTTERRAVERMFESAIQACTDLAKHIASEDFAYEGDSGREAVTILAEREVIDERVAATLSSAIGFRNLLAHEYGRIDPERVYEYLQA